MVPYGTLMQLSNHRISIHFKVGFSLGVARTLIFSHPYPEMRFILTKNRHFQFLFILKVWDIGVSMQKK